MVNTAAPRDNSNTMNMRNAGWVELPMPKGSELYSPMSQALLRAARMGQVNRPPPPPMEDEKELGDDEDAEGDVETGFMAVKWTQVPKEMEEPEMEFLAKRRKGLPSVYSVATGIVGSSTQMRRRKVRKVDEEGRSYIYEVLATEGAIVEGEIFEGEEVMTEAPAPGTVVEGVGIANSEGIVVANEQVLPTPPRRRPPPPKRKAKGPGRGRKKRPSDGNGISGIGVSLQATNDAVQGTVDGAIEIDLTRKDAGNDDTEMGDESTVQDGEEGSDEDDEDGEEGEDGEREEGELSSTPEADSHDYMLGSQSKLPPPIIVDPLPVQNITVFDIPDMTAINREPSSSPDLPLAAAQSVPSTIAIVEPTTGIAALSRIEVQVSTVEAAVVEDNGKLIPTATRPPVESNHIDDSALPQDSGARSELQFVGGDVEGDLLGSLEKHLDGKG